jgi:hypothetical protein
MVCALRSVDAISDAAAVIVIADGTAEHDRHDDGRDRT